MTYFKVDDGMWGHPKFDDVSDAAVALWTRAGSWSSRYLTNGAVPTAKLPVLKSSRDAADELVKAGLWVKTKTGYRFHDWQKHQDSKAEVERRREAWRNEKRRKRSTKPNENPSMSGSDSGPDSGLDSGADSGPESLTHSYPISQTQSGGLAGELDPPSNSYVEVPASERASSALAKLQAAHLSLVPPVSESHAPRTLAARSREEREVAAFDNVTGTRRNW